MKFAPKEINYILGYRTDISMKNQKTWEFAHKYIGKLWYWLGWILIPMLFVVGDSENVVGAVGSVICAVALVILIAPIFSTERVLKNNFDKNGNEKAE